MGKGTGTAQAQLDLQNKMVQDQLDQQKAIRDQVMGNASTKGSIASYLAGGVGFDPATLAAMQSQFLNQNSANFNQAGSQVIAGLNARGAGGGQLPAGGDLARQLSALQGARASSQSQGILGTNIANAQQALNNQFNAASVASGQSAQLGSNIGAFNQGAQQSLNSYITAANAPGFLQSLATSLAGGVGAGLGAAATGGIGAALGGIGKASGGLGANSPQNIGFCWIAECLYGATDVRVSAVRRFLRGAFGRKGLGRFLVMLYREYGREAADFISRHTWLKPGFRVLFDRWAERGRELMEMDSKPVSWEDFEGVEYQR